MYYQKTVNETLKLCHSSIYGLSSQDVKLHQEKYGKNVLLKQKNESPIKIFINQFKDLLVIILIISAIISGLSGQFESTIVIIVVIVMNAILGTHQTIKAQKSLDSLKKLSLPQVKVLRDQTLQMIPGDELTIGDIVQIEAGDVISGDGRIIEASSLQTNESALTGETESIDKQCHPISKETMISNQNNMVFSGSLVTNGTGRYVVTSIGMNSELGKIAQLLNDTQERKTPLQQNLDQFSGQLSIIIIIISILVLFLNIFLAKQKPLDAFMIAVALAVAAIPEALSSIVTIVLSLSTQKMAKEHAIIKNLSAVESLGCISVICSDKTGTLTQNKMTVQNIYFYDQLYHYQDLNKEKHDHLTLLKTCSLCNNASINNQQRIGDPTELALLDLVNYHHFPTLSHLNELPFDSTRKMMSVLSKNHLYSKGAPDVILQKCQTILIHGKKEKLTHFHKQTILKQNQTLASQGLRVLAFAYRPCTSFGLTVEDENQLTFIGLVSLMDPPRHESPLAVKACRQASIKPVMITGDHIVTAKSIALQIGIYQDGDLCLEGEQLNHISDQELETILPKVSVYARVAPEHKIRIVKLWQKQGAIVAMTGDGVNDAPALKQSDIGVAMGITGSEVSKDAANMILTDDNFSTIVKAVIIGRNVYRNIKNAIHYLLSGNFAGILCVLMTSLFFLPTPFYPVHLLFMNLITDSLPAIAIGMEKIKEDVLNDHPRHKNNHILNQTSLNEILVDGTIIAFCTMIAYYVGLRYDALTAATFAFATICLSRLLHGFSCRSNQPIYRIGITSNISSILAFFVGFGLLHLIFYIPFLQDLFMITSLSLSKLIMIYTFSLLSFVLIQFKKIIVKQ